ncbi:hypothetical protein C8J57DRAFT_1250097 [Mycena rebaudengoi]|nr:hypothetical protein C8J57DRAFT_1250097 [Mycena rebaudengoi]
MFPFITRSRKSINIFLATLNTINSMLGKVFLKDHTEWDRMGKDRMGGDGMGQYGRGWDGTGWDGMGLGQDRTGIQRDQTGLGWGRTGQDGTEQDGRGRSSFFICFNCFCMHMLQFFMVSSSIYLVLFQSKELRVTADPNALRLWTSPFQSKWLMVTADPDVRTWVCTSVPVPGQAAQARTRSRCI